MGENAPDVKVTEELNEEIRLYLKERFPECGYILLVREVLHGWQHTFSNINLEGRRRVCWSYMQDLSDHPEIIK